MGGAKKVHMFHLPMLRIDRYRPIPEYTIAKRAFDILFSGIAIVIASPFMLVTAIAIRSDGGPALYKQKRLTKDGKEFNVLKFRSMRVDSRKRRRCPLEHRRQGRPYHTGWQGHPQDPF
ncbi:sugar transferase [Gallintestinimicrobium sp.]|uniref:sugar transferase n=1 Tax=Gallintestinimicrobium sp. TaxID=2981655 RepID=UPI003993B6AA